MNQGLTGKITIKDAHGNEFTFKAEDISYIYKTAPLSSIAEEWEIGLLSGKSFCTNCKKEAQKAIDAFDGI